MNKRTTKKIQRKRNLVIAFRLLTAQPSLKLFRKEASLGFAIEWETLTKLVASQPEKLSKLSFSELKLLGQLGKKLGVGLTPIDVLRAKQAKII